MQGIYGLAELLACQEGRFCRELLMWKFWVYGEKLNGVRT